MLLNQKGLTLLELLVAIAILAIIAVLGVPSFFHYQDYQRAQATGNEFRANLQSAITEAKTRHKFVYVCASSDGTTCSGNDWRSRYIVCLDNNSDHTCDAVLKTSNVNNLQSVSVNVPAALVSEALRFHPGGGNNSATVLLCSKFHENSTKFTINSFGSVSVGALTDAECPSS